MTAVACKLLRLPVLALAFLPVHLAAIETPPGVPNFHQVNDRVYRGGQPAEDSWAGLAKLGVKTVIDLRRDGEDGEHWTEKEAKDVRAAGMRYISVPMQGGPGGPTHDQIAKVLGVLNSGEPVFVHCKKGKDRTGTAIACYRIAYDRWDNQKALDEAKDRGIHWHEIGMKAYILNFDLAGMDAAVPRTAEPPVAQVPAAAGH